MHRRGSLVARAGVLAGVLCPGLTACQDNVATPFPAGLEPLEENPVAEPVGEELRTESKDTDHIHVYGRGFVFSDPATMWALAKEPEAMYARCSTDERSVMPENDPNYESSFLVHYIVRDILTVEWDDQWRYGIVEGTVAAPELGMIRHQKTQGSDFIRISQGTVQILATDDPDVTELAFVEHLDAVSGSTGDVVRGMQDNYNRLRALAHGQPTPSCP